MKAFDLIFCFGLLPCSVLSAGRFDEVDVFYSKVSSAYYSGQKEKLKGVIDAELNQHPDDAGALMLEAYYYVFFEKDLNQLQDANSELQEVVREQLPSDKKLAEDMVQSYVDKITEEGYGQMLETFPQAGVNKDNPDAIIRFFFRTAKMLSVAQARNFEEASREKEKAGATESGGEQVVPEVDDSVKDTPETDKNPQEIPTSQTQTDSDGLSVEDDENSNFVWLILVAVVVVGGGLFLAKKK